MGQTSRGNPQLQWGAPFEESDAWDSSSGRAPTSGSDLAWGRLTWLQSRAHVLHLFSFSRSRGRHPIGHCLPASLHNELRPSSCLSNACRLLSSPQLSRPSLVLGPAYDPGCLGGAGRGRGFPCDRWEAEKAVLRVPGFLVGVPRARGTRGAGT